MTSFPHTNAPGTSIRAYSAAGAVLLLSLALSSEVQGQDLTYTTNTGTITITGYIGHGGNVIIPSEINGLPVTVIAVGAFRFSTITSATVPDTVTNIGFQAFAYCQNLGSIEVGPLNDSYTSLEGVLLDKLETTLIQSPGGKTGVYAIPDGVTTIAEWAFAGCAKLKSITIPHTVTALPAHGMYNCPGLTNVDIGNYVTSIGDQAFAGCSSLTSLRIPNSVVSIGSDVFDACGLTYMEIPDSVTSIGQDIFQGCGNLTGVKLPKAITGLSFATFSNCGLTNISIPESVTNIDIAAFGGCTNLTSITIPAAVSNVGLQAFSLCTNLTGIYFEGNAPAIGDAVFNADVTPQSPTPTLVWDPVTVYYLPGSLGWSNTFGGRPTALWLPNTDTSPSTFGVRSNLFGFAVKWANGRDIVVEASTNLDLSVWSSVSTNQVTNGSAYFSDPEWTKFSGRFYRVRSP